MGSASEEAFVELQGRLGEASSKMKQVVAQIQNRELEKKRATLTLQELQTLPGDTNCYRGIGKAFVLEPIETLVTEFKEQIEECEGDITKLQSTRERVERQIKAIETDFKELMEASPGLAQQIMGMRM